VSWLDDFRRGMRDELRRLRDQGQLPQGNLEDWARRQDHHEAHEGPCLPLANQARPEAAQGLCDSCGRIVRESGRTLVAEELGVERVEFQGMDELPAELALAIQTDMTRHALEGLARDQGRTKCPTCGQWRTI
jgi:hypothetical protein